MQCPALAARRSGSPTPAGRAALWPMTAVERHELAQVPVPVARPDLAFIGAEQSEGASGVIAVVVAGLPLNPSAPGRLP